MEIKDLTPVNPSLAFIVPHEYEADGSINTAMGVNAERQMALVKELDTNKQLVFGPNKDPLTSDVIGLMSYTAKTPQELVFLAMSLGKIAKSNLDLWL